MLADSQGRGLIIWPIRAKLFNPVFLQQRPRYTGGRIIPVRPVLPWNSGARPQRVNGIFSSPRPEGQTISSSAKFKPGPVEARPPASRFGFSGISRDSAGAVLGFCQVLVFRTHDNVLAARTTSDVNGAWYVVVNTDGTHFFVEYKAGSPDVAGTSLNTLTPV